MRFKVAARFNRIEVRSDVKTKSKVFHLWIGLVAFSFTPLSFASLSSDHSGFAGVERVDHYVVRAGETLSEIVQREIGGRLYGERGSIAWVKAWNPGISGDGRIRRDQRLIIPRLSGADADEKGPSRGIASVTRSPIRSAVTTAENARSAAGSARTTTENVRSSLPTMTPGLVDFPRNFTPLPRNSFDPKPVLPSTVRDGVREYVHGDRRFGVVNALNFVANVREDGAVVLSYPSTKKSFDGTRTTSAWLFNSMMVPLGTIETYLLRTRGLQLPSGDHTFYLYYFDSERIQSIADLKKHWWDVVMNPKTYASYSADLEYVVLDIREANPSQNSPNEVRPPRDIRSATWFTQYQDTAHRIALPPGKSFGVTKRVDGVSFDKLYRQHTHIQEVYAENTFPGTKRWDNLRAFPKLSVSHDYSGVVPPRGERSVDVSVSAAKPGDIVSIHTGYSTDLPDGLKIEGRVDVRGKVKFILRNDSDTPARLTGGELYTSLFGSIEEEAAKHSRAVPGRISMGQLCEDGIPFPIVEEIFKKIYERMKVSSAEKADLYGDYFAGIHGYGTDLGEMSAQEIRQGMAGEQEARANSSYYARKAYEYRNRLVAGYIDGHSRLLDGDRIYRHIANLERNYIAMPDRKVMTFGWSSFEGVSSMVERAAVWQRLPLTNGDLIRKSRPEGSFEQLKFEAFFSLLIGDAYLSWNDNSVYGRNIRNFDVAHIGGASPEKNLWQPYGKSAVRYDPKNASHPPLLQGAGARWSDGAAPGHNGGFVGAWLYDQIKDRVDQSLRYAAFSFSTASTNIGTEAGRNLGIIMSGRWRKGYGANTVPESGRNGSAEVSRFGNANPGQANITTLYENKSPVVMIGEGSSGRVAIVLNPYAGISERTLYRLEEWGERILIHTGPGLGVYRLD